MELSEFNNNYLKNFLGSLLRENKKVVLLGDFNVDLRKYEDDSNVSDFLLQCIQILSTLILPAQLVKQKN